MVSDRPSVKYSFPESVEEAFWLKKKYGERARFIAGGTDLLLLIEQQHDCPEMLIDLTRVPPLQRLEEHNGQVTIGAAATYSEILAFDPILTGAPFLARAIRTIGGVQIRNVATLVGNITNASPAGDTLAPLYTLNAQVHIYGQGGMRSMPIEDFVLGVRRTALGPAELVTHVTFDLLGPGWQGRFDKLGLRRAMAIAVVSVALLFKVEDGLVSEARIALGAVAPTVIRAPEAESHLAGRSLDDATIETAALLAHQAARPIDDVRSSAWYRKEAVRGLVRRGLREMRSQIEMQE